MFTRKILTAALGVFLCGCTTSQIKKSSPADVLAPGLGLGGALIGLYAAEGEDQGTQLVATGVGGLAGYLLGEFVENGFEDDKAKEFKAGFDLGRSNASKELYWNYQKLHEAQNGGDVKLRMYELPAVYPDDGINRVPDAITLPVME